MQGSNNNKLQEFRAAYTEWVIQYHKYIVFAVVAIVVALGVGASKLAMTSDFRVFFTEDDPYLVAFQQLEETYEKQEDISFLVLAKEGDLFTKNKLTALWELTEKSWQVPHSQRVTSLTNYQHTSAEDDEIVTNFLVEPDLGLDDAKVNEIKQIALSEPLAKGTLVNEKGDAAIVRVILTVPDDLNAPKAIVNTGRAIAQEIQEAYPEVEVHILGSSVLSVVMGEAIEQDMQALVMLSYLIIFGGLVFLVKSAYVTLATLLVVTLTVVATMGFFGWIGFVLSPSAGFVPSILMTIAVADCVHIFVSYAHAVHEGKSREDAIRETLRVNASPVFITSFTTIIGMLCLNTSESPPYQDLGNMVAVGVGFAYALSLTFFPAILAWLPVPKKLQKQESSGRMLALANFIIKRQRPLLYVMIGVVVLSGFSIQKNHLTENWVTYFDETFAARKAFDLTIERMEALHRLEYSFDSETENGIYQPAYLSFVDEFAQWLRQQPEVIHVGSVVDIIKRLNMHVHNDDPALRTVPSDKELASQLMLLYEFSLPQGMGLESLISVDKSQAKVTVSLRQSDSNGIIAFENRVQAWLAEKNSYRADGNGIDMVFAQVNDRNMKSLLIGTAIGLVSISFVLIFVLRSVRLGLLSLIPNLAPAIVTYGLWGLFVGHIDLALSIVICMSLGIVVDDTVHFLTKYLRARKENGLSVEESIRYSFSTVGVALLTTTIVLAAGFAILAASHFSPTRETGTMLAMTIVAALIMDFFLLPLLLMIIDKKDYRTTTIQR